MADDKNQDKNTPKDDQENNNNNSKNMNMNMNMNNMNMNHIRYVDDERHTQAAYKANKGRLIEDNPYSDLEEFPDESSLFIGDLSRTVTEDMLLKLFSQCGPVDGVDIKRDKVTKNNLGYGFVKFKDRNQAENAKRKMNGMEIGGRAIRIGWAQKNTNLFVCLVGDLEEQITGEHLREIFKEFGPIYEEDTFVKRNKYGFVKFKHRAHAEKAKAALDGQHLILKNGYKTAKPVRIGWGDANTQRNCVHVQFEQNSASNVDLKEEDFKQQFQKYGQVNKVSLPRYSDKRLKGYGFIHFEENDEGEESAAKAITELTNTDIKGVRIQCNFGKRQNQRHKRFAQKKQNNDMNGFGGFGDNDGYNQNNNGMNDYGDNNMNNNYGGNMNNQFGSNDMNQNGMNDNNQFGQNNMNQNDMNNNNQFGQNINNQFGQNNMMNNNMAGMGNMGNNNGMMNNQMMMNNNQMMNNNMNLNNNMDINNNNGMPGINQGPMGNMNLNQQMNNNGMMPPNIGNNNNPPNMNMMPPNMNMNGFPNMPPPGQMNGPPLSGPNPFMPPNANLPPMMMGQPNPMMNQQNNGINVGLMNPNNMPPSPPPPNPNNFKLNNTQNLQQQQNNDQRGNNDGNNQQQNNNNQQQNGNNQQQNNNNNPGQFQLPFNPGLPPNGLPFPAPNTAPQLNMANPNGGTAPSTPNRPGMVQPMGPLPTFLPLGGAPNPMFSGLGGLPPQLSPQLGGMPPPNPNMPNKGTSGSNSPNLNASPPNLFVPPYAGPNPPPPGNMGGIRPPFGLNPNGIPSPNMAQLPGFGINQQKPTKSPSPPVSPLMNAPIPFLPSPQMLQGGNNPNMPPIQLNNPLAKTNINLQLKNLSLGNNQPGIHNPLIMQKNPMLNTQQMGNNQQRGGPPPNQQQNQQQQQGGNRQ